MFIVFNDEVIQLTQGTDRLWRSKEGTIFAFRERLGSVDDVDRCGIGIFSLPQSDPLTDACRPHDFSYSSPGYQAFHTRAEADAELWRHAKLIDGSSSWKVWLLRTIPPILGGAFWENSSTR
jgi:hypothetical protein